MEDLFITTFNYRNFSIPVYKREDINLSSSSYYAILMGKQVDFVSENWESEIREIIDKYLDLILEIDEDAWLAWFFNGEYKDIKLVYKNRILKIFLIQEEISDIKLKDLLYKLLLPESLKILSKIKKFEAKKLNKIKKINLLN